MKNELKSKLGENSWESNAPKDLGGGFNKKSGVRETHEGVAEHHWQGKVAGKTTHTYGVKGYKVTGGGRPDVWMRGEPKNIEITEREWEGTDQG